MTTPRRADPPSTTIAARLSAPRMAPYLALTGHNVRDAVRLYQWNIDLSGAVYEALHVFEVVLRNAVDEQLSLWNAAQSARETGRQLSPDWLMDPAPLLRRLTRNDIPEAHARAVKALHTSGAEPGHPDILAQLNFGTWRFLLPDRDGGRKRLWQDALHRAFPHDAAPPGQLARDVNAVYLCR